MAVNVFTINYSNLDALYYYACMAVESRLTRMFFTASFFPPSSLIRDAFRVLRFFLSLYDVYDK